MAEMTAENAIAIVTQKFRAVHKAIETAQDNALELNAAFLQAGRLLGVHPNDSSIPGSHIADAVSALAEAQRSVGTAHVMAKQIEESLKVKSGGNGKQWP